MIPFERLIDLHTWLRPSFGLFTAFVISEDRKILFQVAVDPALTGVKVLCVDAWDYRKYRAKLEAERAGV